MNPAFQPPTPHDIKPLIDRAFAEDGDDVTSLCFVPAEQGGDASFISRKPGVLCGACLLPMLAEHVSPALVTESMIDDGAALEPGMQLARVQGPLRDILRLERTALNFMTHLSGIATLTRRYVDAVAGTKARIYDTRKTTPGMRLLEKYAVRCGGGKNHRIGLFDAVLVKDNHIAHLGADDLAKSLSQGIARAREATPPPAFVEVEVDSLAQLERVLTCDVDIVLLDNMDVNALRQAVAMRDERAPRVELEASGGVDLESVRGIAETGVDRIAIGALTHSAAALDIGLDIR